MEIIKISSMAAMKTDVRKTLVEQPIVFDTIDEVEAFINMTEEE